MLAHEELQLFITAVENTNFDHAFSTIGELYDEKKLLPDEVKFEKRAFVDRSISISQLPVFYFIHDYLKLVSETSELKLEPSSRKDDELEDLFNKLFVLSLVAEAYQKRRDEKEAIAASPDCAMIVFKQHASHQNYLEHKKHFFKFFTVNASQQAVIFLKDHLNHFLKKNKNDSAQGLLDILNQEFASHKKLEVFYYTLTSVRKNLNKKLLSKLDACLKEALEKKLFSLRSQNVLVNNFVK